MSLDSKKGSKDVSSNQSHIPKQNNGKNDKGIIIKDVKKEKKPLKLRSCSAFGLSPIESLIQEDKDREEEESFSTPFRSNDRVSSKPRKNNVPVKRKKNKNSKIVKNKGNNDFASNSCKRKDQEQPEKVSKKII